jgi:hypothetical protein
MTNKETLLDVDVMILAERMIQSSFSWVVMTFSWVVVTFSWVVVTPHLGKK